MAEPVERGHAERARYRFPPLEKRGVVAGWRGGQIAAVALGLVMAVLTVRSRPSIGGIAVAVFSVLLGLGFAFWPVRGRTGEEWLPLVVRWAWSGSAGDRLQRAPAPRRGHCATRRRGRDGRIAVDLSVPAEPAPRSGAHSPRRGPFRGLSLTGTALGTDRSGVGSAEMAVVIDGPARTATAVLAVSGHSFALLGPGDQDARVAAWARVLSTLAREGSEVHRLQWVESCLPDDGGAVRRYWEDRAVATNDSGPAGSYRALMTEAAPSTRRHRMLVALSLHTARSARAIRASGGGTTGAGRVLAREVLSLQRALEAAEVEVEGVVGRRALARLVARAVAPGAGGVTPDDDARGSDDPGPSWPWPMAVEPRWDSTRVDATWHATYWIAEWPRVDVTPDFLGPLFFSPLRRSIAVTMEPVSPSRAARQVAQSRTADLADGELRRRGGFLVTARHTRERQSVEDRDVELADGHAQYRFSGYVTVTADTEAELAEARAAVEQVAGQARIELRLLYGEQDEAFACSLPLGRGLS